MKKLVNLLLCAVSCIALFGCATGGGGLGSFLGCGDGSEPYIKLQLPVAIGSQQQAVPLPPANQRAVFAAPVQPVAAQAQFAPAFAPSAPYCAPSTPPSPPPPSWQREK